MQGLCDRFILFLRYISICAFMKMMCDFIIKTFYLIMFLRKK